MALREMARAAGPALFFAVVFIGLGAVVWDRSRRDPTPGFPLASAALEAFDAWALGTIAVDEEIRAFDKLDAWAALKGFPLGGPAAEGATLRVHGPLPRPSLPLRGVGSMMIRQQPALAAVFADGAYRALVLVLDRSAAHLLAESQLRLMDEWQRYKYSAARCRLVVWRRGGSLFALVTTQSMPEALTWLPPPGTTRGSESLPDPLPARPSPESSATPDGGP